MGAVLGSHTLSELQQFTFCFWWPWSHGLLDRHDVRYVKQIDLDEAKP